MASGLDTDAMVKALTMPYKQKVDTAKQDQLLMELKKDKWKEVNTKVQGFYTNYLSKMRLGGTFLNEKTNVSNPNLIDITGKFSDGAHELEIVSLAKKAMLETAQVADKNLDIKTLTYPIELKIDGEVVSLDQGDLKTTDATFEDLAKRMQEKIQNSPNLTEEQKGNTQFKYDKDAGGFIINSTSNLELNGHADTLKALGVTGATTATAGKAVVKYNGMTIESNTNEIKLDGVKINLKGTGTVHITSSLDTEGVFDFVKEFVNEYNKLMDELNTMIDAPYNKDYKPLTEEQKKGMSEDEIKIWNEKVEKSILRKDPVLEKLTNSMRDMMGSVVGGNEFGSLKGIGISTGDWKEQGKLYIDETKLKEAIEKNPKGVMDLFAGDENEADAKVAMAKKNGWYDKDGNLKVDTGTGLPYDLNAKWSGLSVDEQKKYMKQTVGIGDRLYDTLTEMFKGDTLKSSNYLFNDKALDKQIGGQKNKVSELERKMYRMEDYYYKKFTAMEKAMSMLNNQSQSLMSQLG